MGITHFSQKSSAMFIDMQAASKRLNKDLEITSTVPADVLKVQPWSPWGTDNLAPQRFVQDIETCGILNGIIEGKARFAICQGLLPAIVRTNTENGQREIEKIVDDAEILEWLEMNDSFFQTFAFIKDQVGFNWGAARFKMDRGLDKIAAFQRDDITEVRFEKKDPATGRSNHLFYSAEWGRVRSPNDERVFKRRLLKTNNPVMHAQELIQNKIDEFAMTFRNPGWGKHYYPTPLWMAAYKWVKIAQGVPEMKSSLFENAMRPKFMVIIHDEYWDNRFGTDWAEMDDAAKETKRQMVFEEIDKWLIGPENAHKSVFAKGMRDEKGTYTDVEIIPIEDNTKAGELLPDSAAANSEIAFAMLWNNAMTGGNQASGVYEQTQGGSNVRESLAMQVIIHEVERQQLRRVMMLPKHINGWAKRLPGLDFIVPATILTTLDTGGSSKPVVTGNAQPKNETPKQK